MSNPIILYDIPSNNPQQKAWSPNTWNARFALNIKGINYKTEWVEYPEIESLCLKIGAKPTSTKSDGRPHYTCPIIRDDSTGTVVSDSPKIAQYLDQQYPNSPKLFPTGAKGLIAEDLQTLFKKNVLGPVLMLVIYPSWKVLNPDSQRYFRETRESNLGLKLEQFVPEGDGEEQQKAREERWKAVQDGFEKLAGCLDANDEEGKGLYFVGDSISFPDVLVAGGLIWMKIVWGNSPEGLENWARVMSWNEGKWAKFFSTFERYSSVN